MDRLKHSGLVNATAALLFTSVTVPTPAAAALWRFEPSVSLQGRFDDNARLTVDTQDEIFAAVVSGSLALSSLTEIREVKGFLRADAISYSGDDENLEDKSNYLAGVEYSLKSPLTEWEIGGSIREDSILRQVDVIDDPGDVTIEPDDDVDDASVETTVRRNRIVLRPSWSRSLSELTGVRLAYRFNTVDYSPVTGTGLTEYEDHQLTTELFRNITEVDEFAGSLRVSRYDAPEAGREYDGLTLEGVWRHEFDETTSGEIRGGVYETEFETPAESGSADGYTFGLEGTKRTGRTRYSIRVRRTLFPTGSGDVVRTNEIVANVFHELSERSRVSLRSRVFENRSLRADNPDANRRYLSVEPRYVWRMTPQWNLDLRYKYQRQNRDTDPESADSNAIYISFVYSARKPLE